LADLETWFPRRRRGGFVALAAALALAGCAAIVPQTPSAIFDLSAPGKPASGRGSVQILVAEPTTIQALDNNRIAARPSPSEYAYLPGAVWSDTLPKLLQKRLVQAFQNSGRIRAAGVPGQGLLIDYQIVTDIRAFELTDEGAVAEFGVKLMDDANGRILRSTVVRRVAPVRSTDNASVVWGLDRAMDEAFLEITRWALAGI
jgi:cholesterol transport system auxiliary component